MAETLADDPVIWREARCAGLGGHVVPSADAVRHRRTQLLGTMAFVVCVAAAALTLLSSPGAADAALAKAHTGTAIGLLLVGFFIYAAEKELHLRKLAQLVTAERELNVTLSQQVYDYAAVLDAARALQSVLALRDVVDQLLTSAVQMVGAGGGAVHLHDSGDNLVLAQAVGTQADPAGDLAAGQGVAGQAAATRVAQSVEVMTTDGGTPVGRALSAPMVVGDDLVGVLTVVGGSRRELGLRELHALQLLATQAAPGLRIARRYELQRRRVTHLFDTLQHATERVASGPHDLRTPLNAIISCSRMARDTALPASERTELLGMMENQSHRLSTMIEDLLIAQPRTGPRPVNMTALVSKIAEQQRLAGQPIEVHTAQACYAVADPEALTRAVGQLVDNAYRYGRPKVQVGIRHHAETVLLSVWDQGAGIPAEERERVFERHVHLDENDATLGLGLAIVRELVVGCGGTVWADEAPGGGAAIHMSLPTAAREAAFAR